MCGAPKGAVNHWWLVFLLPQSLWWVEGPTWMDGKEVRATAFGVMPWEDHFAHKDGVKHLCGQQCAQVLQSQWMDKVAEATNGD